VAHEDADQKAIEAEVPAVRAPAHARPAAPEPAPRPVLSSHSVQRAPLNAQRAPHNGRLELLAPNDWPADDDDSDLTEDGLPRRTRQSNLAPQLREQTMTDSLEDEGIGRSPEQARSLMETMQRGWRQGRSDSGHHIEE
jgi:hypothetical protein